MNPRDKLRFKAVLLRVPKWVRECFDSELDECDTDLIKKGYKGLSQYEKVMVAFVMMVWCGDNSFWPNQHILCNFGGLDQDSRRVIIDWTLEPYWC